MPPVTGVLGADFGSFYDACSKAEVKLQSFEAGSAKVESQLNRMVDSFSGRRIVSEATLMVEAVDRIGGTAKLTTAELERVSAKATEAVAKMNALGITVPPGLQKIASETTKITSTQDAMLGSLKSVAGAFGIAFSVGAVVSYGQSLLTAADHMVTLSARTGLSIEEVQKLSGVAAASGNSIEELSGAMNKLTLGLNDPKAQASIRSLGLNLEALKSASPYEQLRMIAGAIGDVVSPSEQAEHAVALFGKSGMSILPTLRAEFDKLASGVTVASAAQVRALADADAALKRAQSNATAWATSTAGSVVMVAEKFGWFKTIVAGATPMIGMLAGLNFNDMAESAARAATSAKDVTLALTVDPLDAYRASLDLLRGSGEALTGTQMHVIQQALKLNESVSTIAANMNLAENVVSVYAEKLKAAEAAAKKLAETQKTQLATSLAETTRLWAEYDTSRMEHGGTANQQAIAQIDQWARNLTAKMVKAGADTDEFYAGLAAVSAEKLGAVGVNWDLLTTRSIAGLQEQADNALKTFNQMQLHGGFFREDLDKQLALYHQLQDAARGMGAEFVAAEDAAAAAVRRTNAELEKKAEIEKKARIERERPFILNKVNSADASKLTDEQQQQIEDYKKGKVLVGYGPIQAYWDEIKRMTENFIKENKRHEQMLAIADAAAAKAAKALAAAPVLSASSGGGGGGAARAGVAVQNTFHIVDTEANIVRRVSDAITRSLMAGQKLGFS